MHQETPKRGCRTIKKAEMREIGRREVEEETSPFPYRGSRLGGTESRMAWLGGGFLINNCQNSDNGGNVKCCGEVIWSHVFVLYDSIT